MINILIIEDEAPARRKLKRFLEELNEPLNILAEMTTIEEAVIFLKETTNIDLIFCDIELQDGNAFDIFKQVTVSSPIIFTTAYSQFLMDAFEANGIEYLLKPFSIERFMKAWDKFKRLRNFTEKENLIKKVSAFIDAQNFKPKEFKKRLSINAAKGMYFLDILEIVYFEAQAATVTAYDNNGKKHLLTQPTLKELEELIDPKVFFRINRSEMINKEYIERVERASKNVVAIKMKGYQQLLATSQSSTASFREWVEE
ncbi:LytR/AlgR family response regulator transcription factor [Gynurincola endophyticus]|uniref:LytR/AlgR family response regulator transcription factor n=1 Tax=Gynurincola endophyticus TaxID=2479004 RepID=UPI000F8EF691|nr:LytTR family DNA-binding domain-containing protein [Gynurincola endophyticus]